MKKLLKYDFKDLFKYWWIVAVVSLILSSIGGLCLSISSSEKELPAIVYVMTTLLMVLVIVSFAAFLILSVIIKTSLLMKDI